MEKFTSIKSVSSYKGRPLFFLHLLLYIAITTILVVINIIITPQTIWSEWIVIGWGLAVLIHELVIFVFSKRSI